ncbi:hypothetical protein GC096_27725 [Paenibacillus sp. LMG 31461]|uniref:Uncharacterized protein n=1 Tax=Paenibacillus plantarum TaxID=2654975 RepID=A0ABX1XIZ0_9BACL|nr:hypothetical protein [Paenibacillus plantarum]NOU67820.1 hypothetical protein [Paenibacillus plantarum]
MAGNILYIPYTIAMIIGLLILIVIVKVAKRKKVPSIILMISIPIFIIIQCYFWNVNYNNYVKSYFFPSKIFECEYEDELKNMAIPLPKRTVFKGNQNVCSPFYLTYVNERDFKSFYQEELNKLKDKGTIQDYSDMENNKFAVRLLSGSSIEIIHKIENSNLIIIKYQNQS